jgi:hypothetical protein
LESALVCRSVSYATPAYYAHLAAEKSRVMFEWGGGEMEGSVASGSDASGQELRAMHPRILNSMFFL